MEFLGDLCERASEILSEIALDIAAACFLGNPGKRGVRQIGGQRSLKATDAYAGDRWCAATHTHADGINHHVLPPCSIDHVSLRHELVAEAGQTAVHAVTEHENRRAGIVFNRTERVHGLVQRSPERRWRLAVDRRRQRGKQLAWLACE